MGENKKGEREKLFENIFLNNFKKVQKVLKICPYGFNCQDGEMSSQKKNGDLSETIYDHRLTQRYF